MWVFLTKNVQSHVNMNEMVNNHIFVHVYNTYIKDFFALVPYKGSRKCQILNKAENQPR